MIVLPPLTIIASMLTSSTAAEPSAGETVWVTGATCAIGDLRIRVSTHKVYKCTKDGVSAIAPEDDPTTWKDMGPTNAWAMFDTLRNTQTAVASPLTVVIAPWQRVDGIALLGLVADSVTISIHVAGALVYSFTKSLQLREPLGWYDYFFRPFAQQEALVRFDLPPYTNAVITVTLTKSVGQVKCGALVLGQQEFIGDVQYNAENDATNYSKVDRLFDGTAEFLPRRTVPKTSQTLYVSKTRVDRITKLRDERLNGVPAVYSGLDGRDTDGYFNSLLILGFYRKFSINLAHPRDAVIQLDVEEI